MTLVETLHRFCTEMSFGYDQGFTQIWLTPLLYDKLVCEIEHEHPRSAFDGAMFAPPCVSTKRPAFIEFEGRRIYCAER